MVKPLLTIITLLYCASSSAKSGSPPASTITFIAQIEHVELNKTALSHDMKLILADRFYFKTSNPCETNSISARPESMGITDKAYADKLRNLETPFLDDRYFFMTINQCDGNGSPHADRYKKYVQQNYVVLNIQRKYLLYGLMKH